MTQNDAFDTRLRIRITAVPDSGDFVGFDVARFRVGETYEVPTHLGVLLIIAGCAELVVDDGRAEAADGPHRRGSKPKRRH